MLVFVQELRIDITNADIHAAKVVWLAARDACAPKPDVERLLAVYERLIGMQAQQIADDFRRAAGL